MSSYIRWTEVPIIGWSRKGKGHFAWRNGPWGEAEKMELRKELHADDVAEFLDGRGAFHQGRVLFVGELDLENVFQSGRA